MVCSRAPHKATEECDTGVIPAAVGDRVVMHATVIVLGDLGRSPRMQYHALALAEQGFFVDLVGEAGTPTMIDVQRHPGIRTHRLTAPSSAANRPWPRLALLVHAASRQVLQAVQLLRTLGLRTRAPDVVLVQTPPALPALPLALLIARARGARLVVDWHNFSHSMLSLRLSSGHPVVQAVRWSERTIGARADAHLCVSRAMQAELAGSWNIRATVLYDRPASRFQPTPVSGRHLFFRRLEKPLQLPPLPWCESSGLDSNGPSAGSAGRRAELDERTVLTETVASFADESPASERSQAPAIAAEQPQPDVRLRADRPVLLVSATSWTVDEDFDLLLAALLKLDAALQAQAARTESAPSVLMLITGDGPMRLAFERRVEAQDWRHVRVRTLWLSAEDYPLLLGSADLGVCVHRSASGLDLPMKILDMFGAGLPVCAFDYGACIRELVRHEETGLLFSGAEQLAQQLVLLFATHPKETPLLAQLRQQVAEARQERWEDAWKSAALPLLRHEIPA
jgi:beta-1,4-mannosyltransferase